ncbi:hypothetical protein BDR26DRAFT_676606 [Obelidium mucronatum]|nr:hypothetical protein BDR26DRAFT_676606 [Obelidium mucronatum]
MFPAICKPASLKPEGYILSEPMAFLYLNGLQEAMEDMTNATRGYKSERNTFSDKYSTRGIATLRKLAYMCYKMSEDARRSIRDHRDRGTVSRRRFERVKSSWDAVDSALDRQDLKKYSGPELADWLLKQLQAKSSSALSKELEKSISAHSKQIATTNKISSGGGAGPPNTRKCNHCQKLGHVEVDCFARCSRSHCQKKQCKTSSDKSEYRHRDRSRSRDLKEGGKGKERARN